MKLSEFAVAKILEWSQTLRHSACGIQGSTPSTGLTSSDGNARDQERALFGAERIVAEDALARA